MNGLDKDTWLIKQLVAYAGMKPAAVAREAGVAVTTINRPFTGKATTRLSAPTLDKLKVRFPDFPEWETYKVPKNTVSVKPKQPAPAAAGSNDNDVVEISEIDLKYGLGATFLDDQVSTEKRAFSRGWLQNFTRASPASLFWATGDGDSMEPTIRSGEVILIDTSQKTPRMGEGIWAVALGDFGMIKRIHYTGSRLELLSDNASAQIPPIPVGEGELHVIGRVVAVVRRL